MSSKQSYAVFGLGRYGRSVARELAAGGAEVLAVDMDEDIVNAAIADIPYCKCANVTDPEVMRQLGVANVDVAIISMAGNTLNFALNLLGCYVHDLRLQCLEYFNKFYEDGGKPFRPLDLNTKYYNVVKD